MKKQLIVTIIISAIYSYLQAYGFYNFSGIGNFSGWYVVTFLEVLFLLNITIWLVKRWEKK